MSNPNCIHHLLLFVIFRSKTLSINSFHVSFGPNPYLTLFSHVGAFTEWYIRSMRVPFPWGPHLHIAPFSFLH